MGPRLLQIILFLSFAGLVPGAPVLAQQPSRSDDIIRVNTELVQTDFMVFDRQGNFVDGLKRDQLILKVEGKPRDITFFDRITAGSRNEEAQLAAARGIAAGNGKMAPVPLDRGRVVMFFIDDLHLSPSSVTQTRALLRRFVDREMRQNDQASIASVSGQLGFLQQLTDNKAVLTAATERLKPKRELTQTQEYPTMSEYQAQQVDRHDSELVDFYIEAILKDNPMTPRQTIAEMVHARASQILENGAAIATRTLASLQNFVEIASALPGRKLVFFISDGFFAGQNHADNYDRLQRVTAAAARSGVVIYSIDARGLTTGLSDATQGLPADPAGRYQRSAIGEVRASQDAMNTLAVDTGGRAFLNSNALPAAVTTALKETSVYYLLAWRPDNEEQRNPKFRRIEVNVPGRPELIVRFRRGFGEQSPEETARREKDQSSVTARKPPEEEIEAVLRAPHPTSGLPISIALNFLDTAQYGTSLTTAIKVGTASLPLEDEAGTPTALLDLAGLVVNDQGKSVSSFNKRLTIRATANSNATRPPENVFYNHFALIKPGLYQVRVAALDVKRAIAGSARQWIEIPDVQSKGLTMSSLLVGEKKPKSEIEPEDAKATEPQRPAALRQLSLNVDHRFGRSSYLRFLTFIYNAAKNSTTISSRDLATASASSTSETVLDLAAQVQVFRDNEPVITMPLHKIQTEGMSDLQRIPYAAEVQLNDLPPGAYVLQVTIIDRLAKSSASQRLNFEVD